MFLKKTVNGFIFSTRRIKHCIASDESNKAELKTQLCINKITQQSKVLKTNSMCWESEMEGTTVQKH